MSAYDPIESDFDFYEDMWRTPWRRRRQAFLCFIGTCHWFTCPETREEVRRKRFAGEKLTYVCRFCGKKKGFY